MNRYNTEEENKAFLTSLPKKSIAVKAVIWSTENHILLVKPTIKAQWQLPGGGIMPHEEPIDALVREIKEELALSLPKESLRIVGTAFRAEYDNLLLIYEYTATIPEDTQFHIQASEIEKYQFVPPSTLGEHISTYYQPFLTVYLKERA